MDNTINRESLSVDVAFASGATVSSAVKTEYGASGAVYLPAEFATDIISFQGAEKEGGTYALIYDDNGALVTFTAVSAAWHQLHPAVMAMPWIKIVTGTATGGAATAILSMKS